MKTLSFGIKSKAICIKSRSPTSNGDYPHNLPITLSLLFQVLRQKAVFLNLPSNGQSFIFKIKLLSFSSNPNQTLSSLLWPFPTLSFLPSIISSASQPSLSLVFIVLKDHHPFKGIKSFINLSMCRDCFLIVRERNARKNVSQNNYVLKEKEKFSSTLAISAKSLKKVKN